VTYQERTRKERARRVAGRHGHTLGRFTNVKDRRHLAACRECDAWAVVDMNDPTDDGPVQDRRCPWRTAGA